MGQPHHIWLLQRSSSERMLETRCLPATEQTPRQLCSSCGKSGSSTLVVSRRIQLEREHPKSPFQPRLLDSIPPLSVEDRHACRDGPSNTLATLVDLPHPIAHHGGPECTKIAHRPSVCFPSVIACQIAVREWLSIAEKSDIVGPQEDRDSSGSGKHRSSERRGSRDFGALGGGPR